jgi:hypothetical protein
MRLAVALVGSATALLRRPAARSGFSLAEELEHVDAMSESQAKAFKSLLGSKGGDKPNNCGQVAAALTELFPDQPIEQSEIDHPATTYFSTDGQVFTELEAAEALKATGVFGGKNINCGHSHHSHDLTAKAQKVVKEAEVIFKAAIKKAEEALAKVLEGQTVAEDAILWAKRAPTHNAQIQQNIDDSEAKRIEANQKNTYAERQHAVATASLDRADAAIAKGAADIKFADDLLKGDYDILQKDTTSLIEVLNGQLALDAEADNELKKIFVTQEGTQLVLHQTAEAQRKSFFEMKKAEEIQLTTLENIRQRTKKVDENTVTLSEKVKKTGGVSAQLDSQSRESFPNLVKENTGVDLSEEVGMLTGCNPVKNPECAPLGNDAEGAEVPPAE